MELEVTDHLHDVVAYHGSQLEVGQAHLAQVDEVPHANLQQVGQLLFSEPRVWAGGGRLVHASGVHVNRC